jgi:hypothetical protein
MVMIGGIMRLIVVTGGVRKLVQFLSEKNDFVTNKVSTVAGNGGDIVNIYRVQ